MAAWGLALARLRAIPWVRLYAAGSWLYQRGRRFRDNLGEDEWSELGELLRRSKGRRANLSQREYERLRSLVIQGFTGRG